MSLKYELVRLQAEMERRRDADPLRAFKPHSKQQPFIDAMLSAGYSEGWMISANRSGKTEAAAFIGSTLARFGLRNPKPLPHAGAQIQVRDRATSGWVVSLDHQMARNVVQPKYFDNGYGLEPHRAFIPQREIAHWREDIGILRLKCGSLIQFMSVESGEKKAQGADRDWIHFDEEPPKPYYDEATIRIGAGRKLFIFGSCTLLPPVGQKGGVSWMFGEKIKPWQAGKLPKVWLGSASIYDNPYLDRDEIARLESIFPPETPAGRIRLGGEWLPGVGGSIVYTNFSPKIHVLPLPPPSPYHPLAWTWDFNVDPLVSLVGQKIDGHTKIHREFIVNSGGIEDMCDLVLGAYANHPNEFLIFGDASGRNRRVRARAEQGATDYRVISNYLMSRQIPYRLRIPEANPYVNQRVNAVNALMRDHEGGSYLLVDPSCRELIEDFEQVIWGPQGGIKKTTDPKDPYSARTHASDAFGYYVHAVSPLRSSRGRGRLKRIKEPRYGT